MKYLVALVLLCLAFSSFALSLPKDKKWPRIPRCFCIKAPCDCDKYTKQSDIAWVPAAVWAGKALAGGALSAAGKHAYDRFIRRKKDSVEADIAWVPVAVWAAKAAGSGVLAGAGHHAYDKWIRRKKDTTESEFPFGAAIAAYKLYKKFKKDSVQSDAEIKKLINIAKKGFEIYKKAKGFGLFDDEESDAEFIKKLKGWWDSKGKNLFNKGKEIYSILKNRSESDKINWSKIKKYATPENAQKAVDIWKIIRGKDSIESDFYGAAAKWLGQKAIEQAGKFGYNKIFRRRDSDEEEETPVKTEKPSKKDQFKGLLKKILAKKLSKRSKAPKSEESTEAPSENKPSKKDQFKGLIKKILAKKLSKRSKAPKTEEPSENKPSKKDQFKGLIKKFLAKKLSKRSKAPKSEESTEEKPKKKKFDFKSLIAKLAAKRQKKEKKQQAEKPVEAAPQENAEAQG